VTELPELPQFSRAPLEELVRLFGEDNVVRFHRDDVAALPIPSGAKEVLTDVGLPRDSEFFAAAETLGMTPRGYVRIGTDYGTDICVDPGGRVHSIDEAGEYPDRFVNSNLSMCLRFLAVVTAERALFAGRPDEELDEVVEVLADTLLELDKEAFADPESWWSVIFEQMRDGLL
jgi:hypothetical protein